MTNEASAQIVDALSKSLKEHPDQFVINMKVVGQAVSVTNGGIGQINSATGGASGSTAIGNKVVVDGSSVEIARGRADQAMNEQIGSLVAALDRISAELKKEKPDRGIIKGVIDALAGSWVPPMVAAVITSLPAMFG